MGLAVTGRAALGGFAGPVRLVTDGRDPAMAEGDQVADGFA